jgi:hypothetical protein
MKHRAAAGAFGAAALVAAWVLTGAMHAGLASARIDQTHLTAHRLAADACVVRAVVIYTDPYIGGPLTSAEVIAAIARMCAAPLLVYSEDLGLAAADADRLERRMIEAGLRSQLPAETDWQRLRNAW